MCSVCLFSLWIPFDADVLINASNRAIRLVSECVFERERGRKEACACMHACVINLINFTAAPSLRHFYGSSEQPPTSKTKGNVESRSKDG